MLVAREVRRYISPGLFYGLMAFVFALLMAVVYLWNESRTQYAWIVTLKADIEVLQAEARFVDRMEKMGKDISAVRRHLEAEATLKSTADSTEAEQGVLYPDQTTLEEEWRGLGNSIATSLDHAEATTN